jgi:hypothetical protein
LQEASHCGYSLSCTVTIVIKDLSSKLSLLLIVCMPIGWISTCIQWRWCNWMQINILPLAGNLYWKGVFSKQTMTAICYWYDKWLNFVMHSVEMMGWAVFCWFLLQMSIYYLSCICALCVIIISKVAGSFLLSSLFGL